MILLIAIGIHWVSKRFAFFVSSSGSTNKIKVVMLGTFNSAGWLASHAGPLAKCMKIEKVFVVSGRYLDISPDVIFQCPPVWMVKCLGMNLARLLTLLKVAIKQRPQIYMGYHIMPNAICALVVARLFGAEAVYQMTGGPIQVIGGGYGSENPLLAAIKSPSPSLERIIFSTVRCFDAVIVRGKTSLAFVKKNGLSKNPYIITGSIDVDRFKPDENVQKDIDVIYVGRLIENKGIEYCISIIYRISKLGFLCKLGIVGSGPLENKLRLMVRDLNIEHLVIFFGSQQNVAPFLQRSKLFMLLSATEGMSIAMLEAMSTGLPVIVTDVGDLSDVFSCRNVGFILSELDLSDVASKISMLLSDQEFYLKLSRNARRTIVEQYSYQAIASRWDGIIHDLFVGRF